MAFEKGRAEGTGSWPGHLQRHCPHVDLSTIEWMSDTPSACIPYRLLVRVFRKSRDEKNYASPIDRDDTTGLRISAPGPELLLASRREGRGKYETGMASGGWDLERALREGDAHGQGSEPEPAYPGWAE